MAEEVTSRSASLAALTLLWCCVIAVVLGTCIFLAWVLYMFEIVSETSWIGCKFKKLADIEELRVQNKNYRYRYGILGTADQKMQPKEVQEP